MEEGIFFPGQRGNPLTPSSCPRVKATLSRTTSSDCEWEPKKPSWRVLRGPEQCETETDTDGSGFTDKLGGGQEGRRRVCLLESSVDETTIICIR